MRWRLAPLVLLVLVAGCASHREAAKATVMAQQAQVAVARDMALALAGTLDVAAWRERVRIWRQLVVIAEQASGTAVQALAPDGPPQVPTTEAKAIETPEVFIGEVQRQIGRAESENQSNARWQAVAQVFGTWAAAAAGGDWLTTLLTGGGVGGLLLGVAGKAWMAMRKRDQALVEVVRTSNELEQAETPEAAEQIKKRAEKRQRAAGNHTLVAKALVQAKEQEPGT